MRAKFSIVTSNESAPNTYRKCIRILPWPYHLVASCPEAVRKAGPGAMFGVVNCTRGVVKHLGISLVLLFTSVSS